MTSAGDRVTNPKKALAMVVSRSLGSETQYRQPFLRSSYRGSLQRVQPNTEENSQAACRRDHNILQQQLNIMENGALLFPNGPHRLRAARVLAVAAGLRRLATIRRVAVEAAEGSTAS
jgi:hypothetical protein